MAIEERLIQLSKQLISIPTEEVNSSETKCIEVLEPLLQAMGFKTETLEFATGRGTLIAHRPGKTREDLVLSGHLDVVPAKGADWHRPPYEPHIENGKLYGRGSSDMKCAVAAMVMAAGMTQDVDCQRGVRLIFTAGEETGCHGARQLVKAVPRAGQIWSGLIIGEPTNNQISLGHRGAMFIRALCEGVSAHASTPELGDNAIYHAASAIEALRDYSFQQPAHSLLGKPSLSVGTIHGGTNVNTVPDQTQFEIDIRLTPSPSEEPFADTLGKYLGESVKLETMMEVPALLTDGNNPFIQCVASSIAEVTGKTPTYQASPFFCDGAFLAPHFNAPTAIIGPGAHHQAHQVNEWCEISKLVEATHIYAQLIRNWCS